MSQSDCVLNIPYPPTEVKDKNLYYARLLLNNYAGQNGELTAITQYLYQHFISEECYKELAESLQCIARVEMHHLEILGELITKLGGNPLFRTQNQGRNSFWSGKYVSELQNAKRFLQKNIEAENVAIRDYKMRIFQINDPKIQNILERIIKDEEHHIVIFKQYLAELDKKGSVESPCV